MATYYQVKNSDGSTSTYTENQAKEIQKSNPNINMTTYSTDSSGRGAPTPAPTGGGGGSSGGGGSVSAPSSTGTYTDGKYNYTRRSDGSVVKSDSVTGQELRTLGANDPDMKYIPTIAGGTYDNKTAASVFGSGDNKFYSIGNHTMDQASYEKLLSGEMTLGANGLPVFTGSGSFPGQFNIPQFVPPQVDRMTYEEALTKARGKLDPLYQNAKTDLQCSLDIDADRRGISKSQLAGAVMGNKMAEIGNEQSSAVAGMASQLEAQDKANAQATEQQAYQQYRDSIANQIAAWNAQQNANYQQGQLEISGANAQANQDRLAWDKLVDEANLTGEFNGLPTLNFLKAQADAAAAARKSSAGSKDSDEMTEKEKRQLEMDIQKEARAMATVNGYFNEEVYFKYLQMMREQFGLTGSQAPIVIQPKRDIPFGNTGRSIQEGQAVNDVSKYFNDTSKWLGL
jgi:hypothetical protein